MHSPPTPEEKFERVKENPEVGDFVENDYFKATVLLIESGHLVIEWVRTAFTPGERLEVMEMNGWRSLFGEPVHTKQIGNETIPEDRVREAREKLDFLKSCNFMTLGGVSLIDPGFLPEN